MIQYIKNMKQEGFIRSCIAGTMFALALYGAGMILYGMAGV